MDMGLEHRIWNDDFKRVNGKCSADVYFVALTAFFEGSSIQTTIYLMYLTNASRTCFHLDESAVKMHKHMHTCVLYPEMLLTQLRR